MLDQTCPVGYQEVLAPPRVASLVAALRREAREHLPIWFVYLEAIGLLHATLANFPAAGFASLGLPREAFAATVVLPLGWFGLYFLVRIRASGDPRPWKYAALAGATVLLPLAIVAGHRPFPLDHDALTRLFEVSQLVWVGLFVGQALVARGAGAVAEFFGVTLLYGMVLENTGILMGFFHEPSFRLYLGPLPAPLCTVLGWSVVFYAVIMIVERLAAWWPWLRRGPGRQAVAATLLALSLDAQLDPMASMSGVFWRWDERLPGGFLGVPLLNFAAWTGAFLPFAWFVFDLRRRRLDPGRRCWQLALRVPLACALGGAICFAIMLPLEGPAGPSWRILGEAVRRLAGI